MSRRARANIATAELLLLFAGCVNYGSGKGQVFIVWNKIDEENEYDRAIFFFDTDRVLQDLAYSQEEIDR